ncbi:alpha/beta hydrolase [uncultured Thiohalocapsa sp.]|uniref:alpha/beta hydrolase n=1 Tax=uncultured Thiohalocapsa sp. TaxID=768990 RepID=UPI0025E9067B|nr:alpha/beta hydrolase [uncultured Thiohalocapsa sp.]
MSNTATILDPRHYVNVGPNGSFRASGSLHTSPEDIRALFAELRTTDTDRMVVHFHGGLVGEDQGLAGAVQLLQDYYAASRAHPVFFLWETGAIETLLRNLRDIHDTELFRRLIALLAKKLAKYVGVSVGAKGVGQEPDDADIASELAKERPFEDLDTAAATGARGGAALPERQLAQQLEHEIDIELSADPELRRMLHDRDQGAERLREGLAEPAAPGAKGIISTAAAAAALARVLARCIGRWMQRRDHGFYPTLMEEAVRELYLDDFGAWMWGNMKSVAEQMWLPNGPELGPDSHPGRLFLDELAALQRERPDFKVDLVGHSAGSIAICHLLEANAARNIGVRIRNVIFLAPAVRSDLFHNAVVQAPERCRRLRIFTMQDAREREDNLVPFVYTRSLLYLISGVLEPDQADCPILGMERFLSGKAPYDDKLLVAVADCLKAPGADRLVLSDTDDAAPPGLRSAAIKHGGFAQDRATMLSVRSLIDA